MRDVIRIEMPWKPQGIRLFGDPHIDAPDHARELLIHDLEQTRSDDDIAILMGDTWSLVLPQDQKRYSGRHAERLDAIIDHKIAQAVELFTPYANQISVIMLGNHETAVIKYHATDPTARLIAELNRVKKNGKILHGGYACWVQLKWRRTTHAASVSMWLHHGAGGGAPVTKGMIDGNRIKVARSADIIAIAHKHQHIHDQDSFEIMDQAGNVQQRRRDYFVVGGYSGADLDDGDYANGYNLNWGAEKFYNREAQGSVRILFEPVVHHGYIKPRRKIIMEAE